MSGRIYKALKIEKEAIKEGKLLRAKSIARAIALPTGPSRKEMVLTPFWKSEVYEVGVGKPGKESTRKEMHVNVNDMWPYIKKGEDIATKSASFKDIYLEMEHLEKKSRHALELLACLLVRSSLTLDHSEKGGQIIYEPPQEIVDEIKKEIPTMFNVPLEVFLQYLDTIALNEDVKYHTKGAARGKPYGVDAGRPNNLTTCAHLMAVLLNRTGIVDFAYGFSQMRGVSKLTTKRAKQLFPWLEGVAKETEEETA